jgi:hypothetical protein
MEYYETYLLANLVNDLMRDPAEYLRELENFFGDDQYWNFLRRFPKVSSLHLFVEFALESMMSEEIDDTIVDALVNDSTFRLWSEEALSYHSIEFTPFKVWLEKQGAALDEIDEDVVLQYYSALRNNGPLEALIERMTEEVFFILFLNRGFLQSFHKVISSYVGRLTRNVLSTNDWQLFRCDGILRRVRIPTWAKRAVFYRDRGSCALCGRDISGLVNIHSSKHFDHIVPLAQGGINDVTNLQLLCETCNKQKGGRRLTVSKDYERWYV